MASTELLLFELDPEENETQKDDIQHIIKYMGSKKPILDFVVSVIHEVHLSGQPVCDLFAGSCSISAALRRKYDFISNDIQEYSHILAHMYFSDLSAYSYKAVMEKIDSIAGGHVKWFKDQHSDLFFEYAATLSLDQYQQMESTQRALFENGVFEGTDYHLFTQYYSGTYWSFEQCVWIDALRKAADAFKEESIYYAIIASIMYGMSYTTQSTGHFAQYRDGNSDKAMLNILTYRRKSFYQLFKRKLQELVKGLGNSLKTLKTTTLSFEDCLATEIPEKTTVYADPPYAPVHYSRFYHALETLVKYDYPPIEHKGRYRTDRHQSPFSQKTNALGAFGKLYDGILAKKSQLVLSYSDSGVVGIEEIKRLAEEKFAGEDYEVSVQTLDHKHSTMGRFEDHERDVTEYLIIAKLKQRG
jgi:adenine-specific DNA-methyltransferase